MADAGDLTPQLSHTGNCALIEDSDVLPRAKLYSNWLTPPNDQTTLQILAAPQWDPAQSVLVSSNTPVPPPAAGSGRRPGHRQHRLLQAQRHHAASQRQDLRRSSLQRPHCRRLAGVGGWKTVGTSALQLHHARRFPAPGGHTVEFRFQPSVTPLYVTLLAFVVGIILAGWLIWTRFIAKPSPQAAAA